jgi:hypothetical protein
LSNKPKADAQRAEKFNLKEMMKDPGKKGYFRSHGYSEIKVTRMNEEGEMVVEYPRIEIYPLGDHPVLKQYQDKFPVPEAPKTMRLINKSNGKEFIDEGLSIEQAKNDPNYAWGVVYDYTDGEYRKAVEKRSSDISVLMIMICFDMVEEFGIEKIEEFQEALKDLGFTANQLNKIGSDIKALDFLPSKS